MIRKFLKMVYSAVIAKFGIGIGSGYTNAIRITNFNIELRFWKLYNTSLSSNFAVSQN